MDTVVLYLNCEHLEFFMSKRFSLPPPPAPAPSVINPLKTMHICFRQGLSAYRAVNTLHFGYKNQSLNVL
jgi:hypothetical protein